jgi:hypothetical protein
MKYLLLLTILFSGCDFNNEIEVSVKDATTEKIDSVNVYIAAAAYSFKEIAPGETKK